MASHPYREPAPREPEPKPKVRWAFDGKRAIPAMSGPLGGTMAHALLSVIDPHPSPRIAVCLVLALFALAIGLGIGLRRVAV